jgi:leader peptidase (prepilin peptidase)/N-methyltransferase
MKYLIAFIFGAILGSFANVLIYRPIAGLKVTEPRFSICPNCKRRIKWYDNIPILSYVILKGRCRYCKEKISIRYPLVELLYAIIFTTNFLILPPDLATVMSAIFTVSLPAVVTDLKKMLLPDYTWIVILVVSTYANLTYFKDQLTLDIISAVVTISILILLKFRYKNGIGEGDIFLLPVMAFSAGFIFMPLLLLLSSIGGIIFSVIKKDKIIPFGPFIILSGYILTLVRYLYFL